MRSEPSWLLIYDSGKIVDAQWYGLGPRPEFVPTPAVPHFKHSSGDCGVWFCPWCKRWMPWCRGCGDELAPICDDCAAGLID